MAMWRYEAVTPDGETVRGTVNARTEREAINRVENSHDFSVVNIRKLRSLPFGRRVSGQEVLMFTYQIEQMVSSGLTIMEALESIHETFDDNRYFQSIIGQIIESMKNGMMFSEALSEHEKVFSPVYIGLIKSGEESGQIEDVLKRLVSMLEWEDDLIAKSKKVMVYPAIVLLVVTVVVSILMVKVVPQLVSFIKEMGGELGLATTALIATSDFIINRWYVVIGVPIAIVFLIIWMRKTSQKFNLAFDCWLYRIPLIGRIRKNLKLARMSNILAVVYASGISMSEGLGVARSVLGSTCLEKKTDDMEKHIENGATPSEALERTGLMPNIAVRIVKSGEESGRMEQALNNVGRYFDREAKRLIEKLEPAIEPILTAVLAILVLWIMMAVLAPVYDTISNIEF